MEEAFDMVAGAVLRGLMLPMIDLLNETFADLFEFSVSISRFPELSSDLLQRRSQMTAPAKMLPTIDGEKLQWNPTFQPRLLLSDVSEG